MIMRKYILYALCFVAIALCAVGCYDDEGNYDYHEVNMVDVVIPQTSVRMPKDKAVEVSIVPKISQTLEQMEDNLAFQWRRLKENAEIGSDRFSDYEDYSVGKECKITIEPEQATGVGLMLIVSNKKDGTTWYQFGKVSIIKPFNPCWFVLQEKDEKGILGVIEGNPEAYSISSDVFKMETGGSFPLEGKPLAVAARRQYGDPYYSTQYMFELYMYPALMLVTNQALSLFTPSTLQPKYESNKILFEPYQQGKVPNIEYYKMTRSGELIVNDGKAYFSYMDGYCLPFTVKMDDELPSLSAYGSYGQGMLFFDMENHRFLYGSTYSIMDYMKYRSNKSKEVRDGTTTWSDDVRPKELYTFDESSDNAFDPDNIDPSLQIKDMVTGGNYGYYTYAIAARQGEKALTVFKFNSDEEPECAAKYENIQLPAEVDLANAKFAASHAYAANIIFMTSGNKLYRINLDRALVTELYAYSPDPSAQISCLKFKDSESVGDEDEDDEEMVKYKDSLGMCLGLGINTGDKGVVVEIQLTIAGDVSRAANGICVYENPDQPIGKIVDITYNYELE